MAIYKRFSHVLLFVATQYYDRQDKSPEHFTCYVKETTMFLQRKNLNIRLSVSFSSWSKTKEYELAGKQVGSFFTNICSVPVWKRRIIFPNSVFSFLFCEMPRKAEMPSVYFVK